MALWQKSHRRSPDSVTLGVESAGRDVGLAGGGGAMSSQRPTFLQKSCGLTSATSKKKRGA